MIKKTLLGLIFLVIASFTSAQSLQDNQNYRKSVKLKIQSETAFEEGDYEESTKLANESILYAEKSDEWIAMMLRKYKANYILKKVRKRIQTAKRLNAHINFPEAMTEGTSLYDKANQLYSQKDYLESYPVAMKAFEVMKVIQYVKQDLLLPAAYLVMDVPGDEDCLWKIAEYDFIFGDALQWELIYEANKDILPEAKNPDLITAGLVLKIPSLNGEERSGTWINGSIN
jgi:hypothetical protein